MKASWKTLHHKINNLTLRERKLVLLTAASFVLCVIVLVILNPLWARLQVVETLITQYQVQIETAQNSIKALELRAKSDVNAPYISKLNNLKDQVDKQQENINRITTALIQPDKMTQVFKGILLKNNLKFDSLKNAPASLVKVNKGETDDQILYRHSLSLQLQGPYLNGLNYIRKLEQQEWQLYWDELEFQTLEYPIGQLKIRVHTLSTSNKVLGL